LRPLTSASASFHTAHRGPNESCQTADLRVRHDAVPCDRFQQLILAYSRNVFRPGYAVFTKTCLSGAQQKMPRCELLDRCRERNREDGVSAWVIIAAILRDDHSGSILSWRIGVKMRPPDFAPLRRAERLRAHSGTPIHIFGPTCSAQSFCSANTSSEAVS